MEEFGMTGLTGDKDIDSGSVPRLTADIKTRYSIRLTHSIVMAAAGSAQFMQKSSR
jgi:hypothetical protein